MRRYGFLFDGLTQNTLPAQLMELDLFPKHWYKDLAGTGWHDSHKPDEAGAQGGYYGYWSFEAGAAVLLLGIEDGSSLHKYLYYPKGLVDWPRRHAALSEVDSARGIALRAMAGEPCTRDGYWSTPARIDSRRAFRHGDIIPEVGGDYGPDDLAVGRAPVAGDGSGCPSMTTVRSIPAAGIGKPDRRVTTSDPTIRSS